MFYGPPTCLTYKLNVSVYCNIAFKWIILFQTEQKCVCVPRNTNSSLLPETRSELYQKDNPDWVPTVNMGTKLTLMSPELMNGRYKRRKGRNMNTDAARTLLMFQEQCDSDTMEVVEGLSTQNEFADETGTCVQTDIDCSLFSAMESELQDLKTDNLNLKAKLMTSSSFSLNAFEGNDENVKFFTELTCFDILFTHFAYLEPHLPTKHSIGKFECLGMTLARLRLNLSVSQLAYQMNVSVSTISRTFSKVIDVMYVRMERFIIWPDREDLRRTMPMQFRRHFGTKCAVIIDCFEVFIERASNLKARAES